MIDQIKPMPEKTRTIGLVFFIWYLIASLISHDRAFHQATHSLLKRHPFLKQYREMIPCFFPR